MEDLIKENSKNYLIFRIPQIIGNNGNSNNLVNYLIDNIKDQKSFIAYDKVKRSIMDVKDVVNVVDYCVGKCHNEIIYISGLEMISVVDLVEKIGYILNVKPLCEIQEKEEVDGWDLLDSNIFKEYIIEMKINSNSYTERILKNYIK
tara:strand:+ start:69 stop:509 length:441 start_codon:yes stop_codon:yes gene_type:complete